jgi:hypothetical protein
MAWLSRVNFIASDTLSFTDVNNLGNDIRAWGDNVNGGGYTLSNVVVSAASITTTGNVGIGTSTPLTAAHIAGISTSPLSELGSLLVTGGGVQNRLAMGFNSASTYGWIQSVVNGVASVLLALNPNGGNVCIGTTTPAASTALDVTSTTGALLVPRMTTTQRNALTPSNGMILYNTTDNQMQARVNGAWVAL